MNGWVVEVLRRDDGQLEIRTGSATRGGTTVGVCPSDEHAFGVTSESREGLVATLAPIVASARLDLDDGSTIDCILHPIDQTDVRFVVAVVAAGVHVGSLIAFDRTGSELGRLDHEAERRVWDAEFGGPSPLRRIR